mmetsp:Transcript_11126/g.44800  ORF Transcript_11126/g.44800 Transcript_11126/m.44800 type:complete len:319 (-) Transcript_11126:547-1503(-)
MPQRGPPSLSAVSASTAAALLLPTRMRASARLASMAGRHAAKGVSAPFISSISSANVYSSSAPAKSPHQQKMLAMHRQILACSSGVSESMFTASNARSSHVESSGIGSPSCRFLAKSDMARSAKCSFSVYSSVVMSFSLSFSSFHAFVASLFSTASTIATSTPCGHAFLRKSYHSCDLTQSSPMASHSLSICSRDISNTFPPLLPPPPFSLGVPLGPSVGVAPVGVIPSGVTTVFLTRSSPRATATDFGSSCAARWYALSEGSLPPAASYTAPSRRCVSASSGALSTPASASIIASQICPSASLDSLRELMISPTMRR